jgi:hypothetical protein
VLAAAGIAVLACTLLLAEVYRRSQADWISARGLISAREFVINKGGDSAQLSQGLRDELTYEKSGALYTCHWDDRYAPYSDWLARARAQARASHWRIGMRVRIRIDPQDPSRCRPAYGWPEAFRLELSFGVLLALFLGGTALFVHLEP